MAVNPLIVEPSRLEEPTVAQAFSDVLSQVASERSPIIVQRNGQDLAAVIPIEYLELLREVLARQEAEQRAARINWEPLVNEHRPPQAWFDDTDNPFEPEEEPTP